MAKPRVIIADEDTNYIVPLQFKFVSDFFDKIDLEIITDREYFNEYFSKPQNAEILIVSEELYDSSLQRHNVDNIFVMCESQDDGQTGELNVNRLFKYSSIKEIFNEIVGKSAGALNIAVTEKKETQIILVTSAAGGVGKTTISMGVAASLAKNYKRVLYINASYLQVYQQMLDNPSSITTSDVYAKLAIEAQDVYSEIKHVIRKEAFNYLPPFKASLMSLGLSYSVYEKVILSAKKSEEYDFIIVDADTTFDEDKAELINLSDKVLVVTKQTIASVLATNLLVSNINGVLSDKYIFVCNDFDKEANNALINPSISLKFTVSDYVERIRQCETMKPSELVKESSIQRMSYLVM
jgi:cellulose biosynthesis protein BcsQ